MDEVSFSKLERKKIEKIIKEDPSILENDSELENLSKKTLINVASARFQGPIPHPELMKGYEEALPGSADRILRMAEEQSSHRRKMEEQYMRTQSRDSLMGIMAAFLIAIVIVVCGTVIIINVPSTAGVIAGSLLNLVGIGTVVGTFLRGPRKSNGEEV